MGIKVLIIFEIFSMIALFTFLVMICFNKNYVVCEKSKLMENDGFIKELGPLVSTKGNNI